MLCRGCGYSLMELQARTCPECGREFDPADPASYVTAKNVRIRTKKLAIVAIVGGATPLLLTSWLYLSYLVGRIVLGRWPETTGFDDPQNILVVKWMQLIAFFGVLLWPVPLILGLGALITVFFRSTRLGMWCAVAVAASWGVAALLSKWIDVWGWLLD